MARQKIDQKIASRQTQAKKAQSAFNQLQKKLGRGEVTDKLAVRFNPLSTKKLITVTIKF